MKLATVTEFATMLTAPGSRAAPALPALTELSVRERELVTLVTLVTRGNTDAQTAGELFIRISTVCSHLDRIRHRPAAGGGLT